MKNLLFILLVFAAVFTSGCATDPALVGSDTIATEVRSLADFDRVSLNGVVDVNITQGTDFIVTVRANDNLLDRVETRLSGGNLEIGLTAGNFRNVNAGVDIVMPTLAGIAVSGTADAVAENFQSLTGLAVDISGTGVVNVRNGNTDLLTANISGTGELLAFSMTAATAEVNVSGTGGAEVTVSDALSGSITGTGNIRFRGNPTLNVSVTGTGELVDAN